MINLASRGLPMRPDQNPLAARRETMAGQGNPMAQQLAQAEALRQDPSGVASPQSQGMNTGMAPNLQSQMQGMQAIDPLQVQQSQRAQMMRGRGL